MVGCAPHTRYTMVHSLPHTQSVVCTKTRGGATNRGGQSSRIMPARKNGFLARSSIKSSSLHHEAEGAFRGVRGSRSWLITRSYGVGMPDKVALAG